MAYLLNVLIRALGTKALCTFQSSNMIFSQGEIEFPSFLEVLCLLLQNPGLKKLLLVIYFKSLYWNILSFVLHGKQSLGTWINTRLP